MLLRESEKILREGFKEAHRITKQYATTYYLASLFLPKDKRDASYAVYAICRISDDAVDTSGENPELSHLKKNRERIESAYKNNPLSEPLLLAFRETVRRYKIPKSCFDELSEGMLMDLNKSRYQEFSELYDYCYRVAGVIGLAMLKIFGCHDKEAEKYAVDLGIAMQLTNIARDIKEDFGRGRIYLPLTEMRQFGLNENDIGQENLNDNLKEFLKAHIKRARKYYNSCVDGIRAITDFRSRLVVCVIKDMYAGILKAIEKNNYDVFRQRIRLNNLQRLLTILKTLVQGEYL